MSERTEFTMRTVSEQEVFDIGNYAEETVKVTRTRTSKGYAAINIAVGVNGIELSNDKHGAGYETIARALANMIDKISDDPCRLPKVKEAEG